MQSPLGSRIVIAGRERDYFSGTGYLGLHNHPQVLSAAMNALTRYGMATGTSRGGYGEHDLYDALESAARAFFAPSPSDERVLYYPSGYLSAVILAQGLADRIDHIFVDDSAHYSVWDGARATGKPVTGFAYRDPDALCAALRRELKAGQRALLMSDGVFPISGEISPVQDYVRVLSEFSGSWIALDDAHAAGVLGARGRGTLEAAGFTNGQIVEGVGVIAAHTLSKGIGGYGGVICAPTALIDALERGSRVAVGASPPPLPIAAASAQALALARDDQRRSDLWQNVRRLRSGLNALGWELGDSTVPILCLRARPALDLAALKDALFARDLCVAHVRSYSSTPAGGCLRIAVFATHTPAQVDRLIEGFAAVMPASL